MGFSNLISRPFYGLHDFLNVGQAPEKAECIFVYAGRPERKSYGLKLFKEGYANCIIFSVGRFEWRGFLQLGLEQDGGLVKLVQKTPAQKRHFFIYMNELNVQCFLIVKGRLGTLSEARALAEFIQQKDIKSLIIVSSAFHLRRAQDALKRYCSQLKLRIIPVAAYPDVVKADMNSLKNFRAFSAIAKECVKYAFYKIFPLMDSARRLKSGITPKKAVNHL